MCRGMCAEMSRIQSRLPPTVVLLDEPFWFCGDQYYSASTWWRFAAAWSASFEEVMLLVPLSEGPPVPEATIVQLPANVRVLGRPFYRSVEAYYRGALWNRRETVVAARHAIAEAGLVILRLPAPPGRVVADAAERLGKPVVVLLAGDVLKATSYAGGQGWKALLARTVARHMRRQEIKVSRQAILTACWGRELADEFSACAQRICQAADPNISRSDIWHRTDTCQHSVIRLLRVGAIVRTKGLEYFIDAVSQLLRRGYVVGVDIVGPISDREYHGELLQQIISSGLCEVVTFQGRLEYGEQLFEMYRQADVHIVSSVSEGVPRCIAEARCFGLPTVATRVGGVPDVIQDGVDGVLVEPHDAGLLCDGIQKVIDDGPLRRQIIEAGYGLAYFETREHQIELLTRQVRAALAHRNSEPTE